MKIKLLVSVLLLAFSSCLVAQDNYHRLFNISEGENIVNLAAARLDDGGYAMIGARITDDGQLFGTLIFSTIDIKGDLELAKEVFFDIDSIDIVNSADIINIGNDMLIISAVLNDISRPNKVLMAVNSAGEELWSKTYSSGIDDTENLGSSELESFSPNTYLHSGIARELSSLETYLAQVDRAGEYVWAQNMAPSDTNSITFIAQIQDIDVVNDTTDFVVTGLLDTIMPRPFLASLDSDGAVQWSRSYLPDSEDFVAYANSVDRLSDSSYVFGGTLLDNIAGFYNGFVTKTDTVGKVQWTRRIAFPGVLTFTLIDNVMEARDGGILVSGNYLEFTPGFDIDDVTPYIIKFDFNGNVVWQNEYNSEVFGSFNELGALLPTEVGAAYFTSGVKSYLTGGLFQELIKIDNGGNTMCQDTITDEVAIAYQMTEDTLIWGIAPVGVNSDLTIEVKNYDEYDVKILSLSGYTFCPNDVIDTFLVATIGGASYYEWNTGLEGPDADTLFITETGTYHVTVTVSEEVCYTLCDTTVFERYELPSVLLNQTLGTFCEDGSLLITALYTPGHVSNPTFKWSTGDSGSFIKITEVGSYEVTVTDGCGEMATDDIVVTMFPQLISQATGSFNPDCAGTNMSLSLMATADAPISSVVWTGPESGSGNPFMVSTPGIYTGIVRDICDNEFTVIVDAQYPVDIIGLSISNLNDYCDDGSITLRLEADSGSLDASDIIWNTNQKEPIIEVTNPGTYSVTVTDNCGFVTTASIQLTDEQFPGIFGEVSITEECVGKNKKLELIIEGEVVPDSYQWSNGSNDASISVSESGTYSVTVTNFCGTATATTDIIIDDCGCLKYPKVFFPQGQEDLNRTFGPVNECLSDIENYEFRIFNRWGEMVFESTEVESEWNGLFKDKAAPSEVYIFYAKYSVNGEEFPLVEGDVTLLR